MMVWLNGEWKEEGAATIDIGDGGFLRGEGVFETMLGLHGRVFQLAAHWDRLQRGAGLFDIPLLPLAEAAEICESLLARNGLTAGSDRVRIRVTRTREHLLFTARVEVVSREPIAVMTSRHVRNERSALSGIKAISYGENLLALREGQASGVSEVLLANTLDEWCEGTWSNLFAVEDGVILTPPLAGGCLPGTTRAVVLELARSLGIEVRVESRAMSFLAKAPELFLTSSLRGVVPVQSIDGRELAVGVATRQLAEALAQRELSGS